MQGDGHYLHRDEAGFEDGTVDYLNLPAVETGLRHIERVGLDSIHDRLVCLTAWLLDSLTVYATPTVVRWSRSTDPPTRSNVAAL